VLYDGDGNITSLIGGRGDRTTLAYDLGNRPTQQTDALGGLTTLLYDQAGNLTGTLDPRGDRSTLGYDSLNRVTSQTDPLNHTVTVAYDPAGNVTKLTDPLGYATQLGYDAINRMTSSQDPAGGIVTTAYDPNGNVTSVADPLNHVTAYAYDQLDRLTQTTDARGGLTTELYDAAGNLTNLIDVVGNKTTFLYDGYNRQTGMIDPLGNRVTYSYDGDNRLTQSVDRLGRTDNFAYDAASRLTAETWLSATGSTLNNLTFTYDANSNLTGSANAGGTYTMAYDQLDRLTSSQEPFGLVLTYSYDAASDRTRTQDSFGGTTTYLYDAAGRLTSEKFGGTGQTPLRVDMTYTARDQLASETRYSNLTGTTTVAYSTYLYDAVGRVTSIQHQDGSGNTLANYTYAYDPASRLTSKTDNGTATSYGYDATNELTSAGGVTYGYDLAGNRTMTGYTTGTGNQMTNDGTWTYTYDAEGNVAQKSSGGPNGDTWKYTYDNQNHMTSAVETANTGGTTLVYATYTYDAFGNLVEEDVWTQQSGSTTVTRYGSDGSNTWADLNGSNALQTRYLSGDNVDQVFAQVSAAGAAAWYLTDNQGSVRNVTNASGTLQDTVTYDAFGSVTYESNPVSGDQMKYAGGQADGATGLDHFGQRWYDPRRGDWTTQDSMGYGGGDTNLYRYVANSPTNATDPTGQFLVADKGALAGYQEALAKLGVPTVAMKLPSGRVALMTLDFEKAQQALENLPTDPRFNAQRFMLRAMLSVGGRFNASGHADMALSRLQLTQKEIAALRKMFFQALDGDKYHNSEEASYAAEMAKAFMQGVRDGAAMVGNQLTMGQIQALNAYVQKAIAENGDLYRWANAAAGVSAAAVHMLAMQGAMAAIAKVGGVVSGPIAQYMAANAPRLSAALTAVSNATQPALQAAAIANQLQSGLAQLDAAHQALANGDMAGAMEAFGKATIQFIGLAILRQQQNMANCFTAGTLVATPTGARPIERIQAGDDVWGYDLIAAHWRPCRVRQTFCAHVEDDSVLVRVAGQVVQSTFRHPYWVLRGESLQDRPRLPHLPAAPVSRTVPGRWVDAGDLRAGDELLLRDGSRAPVEEIRVCPFEGQVYNFEVEDLHCYAVGPHGLLVHNKNGETLGGRPNLPPHGQPPSGNWSVKPGATPTTGMTSNGQTLVSGHGNTIVPSSAYSGIGGPRVPGVTSANFHHPEMQMAYSMQQSGLTNATIWHNCPFYPGNPGMVCDSCMTNIPKVLPKGSQLTVVGPNNLPFTFHGGE
jgi:RHS repeat-associated protein